MGQNVQSAALECPRWCRRRAGGHNGLLLPREGHQRRDTYGPGDQGSRFAGDPGAPGVARGTPARRRGRPGRRQHPEAQAPSSGLAQDR
eukprot:6387909-Alexandrium_andersonii.AAC.1